MINFSFPCCFLCYFWKEIYHPLCCCLNLARSPLCLTVCLFVQINTLLLWLIHFNWEKEFPTLLECFCWVLLFWFAFDTLDNCNLFVFLVRVVWDRYSDLFIYLFIFRWAKIEFLFDLEMGIWVSYFEQWIDR